MLCNFYCLFVINYVRYLLFNLRKNELNMEKEKKV